MILSSSVQTGSVGRSEPPEPVDEYHNHEQEIPQNQSRLEIANGAECLCGIFLLRQPGR